MATGSDVHGKRLNQAAGARPERELTGPPELPKRNLPSDLQPATFAHRVGLTGDSEDTALIGAQRAFNGLSRVLTDLHARERTIRADGSKTVEHHKMSVAQMVDKNLTAPADGIETARATLMAEIDGINSEIETSFRTKMDREDAQELRAIMRGMTREERRKYLNAAMKEQNFAPIAATLAHPEPVASGMNKNERATFREQYERTIHGENVARRNQLEAAVGQLEEGWSKYMSAAARLRDSQADEIGAAAKAADDAISSPLNLGDE